MAHRIVKVIRVMVFFMDNQNQYLSQTYSSPKANALTQFLKVAPSDGSSPAPHLQLNVKVPFLPLFCLALHYVFLEQNSSQILEGYAKIYKRE